MTILCIYHGNCADGFGAAWVVRRALGDEVEFHPGFYGKAPPDVTVRDILLVDFSYKRSILDEMARVASSIVILDHHKTAQEDLAPFAIEECGGGRFTWDNTQEYFRDLVELGRPPVLALFDMKRSGAGITWDYFYPNDPRPELINHLEDRDLWIFKLSGTRDIQASVFSYPYDFEIWDRLISTPMEVLALEGGAIERKHHKDIAELVGVSKRRINILGWHIPVANLPYTLSSDAGHLMGKGEPFAACYMDQEDGRVFSLRSAEDGVDVSEVAKKFGGGGHAHAAGFKVPRDHELARI